MELKYPNLFKPIHVNGKYFKNRLLSAPIGAWMFSPENYVFDYAIDMYGDRARGGAASVILGHTEIVVGTPEADDFGLYFKLHERPQGSAGLAEFAYSVRQHGAHVGIQLNHSGANIHGKPGNTYYAPVDVERDDGVIVKAMDKAKIDYTIGQYKDCIDRMKTAGFDMVMLHGGHGWLLQQFLSPEINKRTDEYGGSLENRMRFPVEVVNAVREVGGPDFIIEYRVSGIDPEADPVGFEELVTFIKAIEDKIDILNISSGSINSDPSHTFPSYLDPRGTNIELAAALKPRVSCAVAVVGNISDPDLAEKILADGTADFVSMARALTADPELPRKARCGNTEDIRPCIGCYNCLEVMHNTHFYGCDVNPRTGREHRIKPPQSVADPKKVVVIGGGPAGMEAALTASKCGHEVVLFEKSPALGGLLKITDNDPTKYLLNSLKNYYVAQVAKSRIKVRLNTEATKELVASEKPDAIILATGSLPIVPRIPGADGPNVYTAVTAHLPEAKLGKKVTIIGGNMVGCETAISLGRDGKEVTLIEMTGTLHNDSNAILDRSLDIHLGKAGVNCITNAKCTSIDPNGVTLELMGGAAQYIEADSVVLAVGMAPQRGLADELYAGAGIYFEAGDCIKPATLSQATRTGHYAALDI